jgi:hypothetical protein
MAQRPRRNNPKPDQPVIETDAGKGPSWREFLRGGVIFAVVIFLLAAFSWWIAKPRGELRLALDTSVQGDPEKTRVAAALFQLADSQVDEAGGHHARLSFEPVDAPLVSMPPTESPGGHTLQNLITSFVIETAVDQDTGRVALSIDGVALLEALYGVFGWYDYFLSFTNVEQIECPQSQEEPCYRVFAHFSPSEQRTETFAGTVETISSDLAVLVMSGVVRRTGAEFNRENRDKPEPYLFAGAIPTRMSALEKTAMGIEILEDGTSHPTCQTREVPDCRDEARKFLEEALDEKKGGETDNPVAAFALSLIATQEGLDAASALSTDTIVEAKLQLAERLMKRAQKIAFLNGKLGAPGFAKRFQALQLGGQALDENFYRNVGQFVCALDAYRQADWAGCLDKIGELQSYPSPLRPYLEAAKFYAALMHAASQEERGSILADIRQRLATLDADASLSPERRRSLKWPLQRVIVLVACVHNEIASEGGDDAEMFLADAPDEEARRIAKVEVAGCRIGTAVIERDVVEELDQVVDTLEDAPSRHRLELALAKYYVRVGQFDDALALLKNAIELPYVGPYVRSAPEFAAFMESGGPADAFVDAYLRIRPTLRRQQCQGVEL